MQKVEKEMQMVLEGLTAYAIERQSGFERHQPTGTPPWTEQRRYWTDAILQGMARLEGLEPDPTLMERYDQRLEQARSSSATELAPIELQRKTVRILRNYVRALDRPGEDRRRQMAVVRDLLEDMVSHLPWAGCAGEQNFARDTVESTLLRVTARMPFRFTRILLGGDLGPCESDFVGGTVMTPEDVRGTELYESLSVQHPEIEVWPAISTVYTCGPIAIRDADEFDLGIMREAGDRFLKLSGVTPCGWSRQMEVPAEQGMEIKMM